MKVVYISVYRDGTGYANAAIHNMLALEAGGVDVVARAISLSQSKNHELAKTVQHLEDKTTTNIDVVMQHILPHMFEYKTGVKNIGLFDWETTHFKRSNWPHCCNMMDEIWVPSLQNRQATIDSRVTVPIKILPHACNIQRFNKSTQSLNIPDFKNKCVFYTIGEMTRRKNIVATIRAFYTAFSKRDDVILVIKTNVPKKNPKQSLDILRKTIEDIRQSVHTYVRYPYYPPIACMTNFLSDIELDRLHQSCDVFVSPSHGEAWGIPAHDAMGFGNPVILSNWGSFPELMNEEAERFWMPQVQKFAHPGKVDCGWLIEGQLTPCFGHVDSFPDLYTGDEYWFDPDIQHLVQCMRQAYIEWQNETLTYRGQAAKNRAIQFSYQKIGLTVQQLLCNNRTEGDK